MNDWQIIEEQAKKALSLNTIWTSFKYGHKYEITEVKDKILIKKPKEKKPAYLTSSKVELFISRIKSGAKSYAELKVDVVIISTMVALHPFIHRNSETREIFWNPFSINSLEQTLAFIKDAPNDEIEKIEISVNQRKYQSDFKKNLLALYESKCAISENEIIDLLEAAHISNHSVSRDNSNSNGILLRADLHILFDRNLLLIHPKNLTVHLSPNLIDSEYNVYDNKKIRTRIDGTKPSEELLKEKWNAVNWTKFK